MKKIPLSKKGKHKGKYFALVDNEDFEYLNQFNWCIQKRYNGYFARSKLGGLYGLSKTISMHRFLTQCLPNKVIDHINHNTLDNTRKNLRICYQSENIKNQKLNSKNTSGFKGVWWRKDYKKWVSTY